MTCRPAAAASEEGRRPRSLPARGRALRAPRVDDLKRHSDVLRLRRGNAVTVRFVEPRDADELQNYFRSLSTRSRYNRFLGAMSELPATELDHFIHIGE